MTSLQDLMTAEALLNVKQHVQNNSKQRISFSLINSWGAHFDNQISVIGGVIVEVLFMLFSIYNAK